MIYIQPVGTIQKGIIEYLIPAIRDIFSTEGDASPPFELPEHAYNPARKQHHSSIVLEKMMEDAPPDARLLGVADVDLYVPGLNFVFGEACGNAAIISVFRLREEFYGRKENPQLFIDRIVKEAVHELGHISGLRHCPDVRCVMHFSNCLEDTDMKSAAFCHRCAGLL